MASPTAIAAYLALFAVVGFAFVFVNLLVGRFLRPVLPNKEKGETYECGETAIGSSFVQFDLRFYVVALLFIIFDVEVAFFFPWATVFGKANQLADERVPVIASASAEFSLVAAKTFRELGVPTGAAIAPGAANAAEKEEAIRSTASRIAWASFADICLFFAVLLVGFAYVWKRGDLDWVRAVSERHRYAPEPAREPLADPEREAVLSA